MKTLLTTLMFIGTVALCKGQAFRSLQTATPSAPYDNIHVQALDDDSLASTYLIWVKHTVKEHFHAAHTEVVYGLSGQGSDENNPRRRLHFHSGRNASRGRSVE